MNDANNFEHLTRLTLRTGRLVKLARSNAPAILIRNEALLILSAAFDLDARRDAKRVFADWIANHPEYAPDGGALVDLRNDTIDECVETISYLMEGASLDRREMLEDVAEKVADIKTEQACAELGGLPFVSDSTVPALSAVPCHAEPLVTYAVIVDRDTNPETVAFLEAAKARGFELMINEKCGTVHVRATEEQGASLEKLRAAHFDPGTLEIKAEVL